MTTRHGCRAHRAAWALSLFTAAPLAAQDAATHRTYDVRALQATHWTDPQGVDLRLPLVSSQLHELEPGRWDVPLEPALEFGDADWSEIFLDALGEDWPDGDLYIEPRAGLLHVQGSARTHQAVAGILADLERRFLGSIEVEVQVLDPTVLPPDAPAVLSAAQVEELFASGAVPLDYLRKPVRFSRRELLGTEGTHATLYDYDVEVASSARAADPQVTIVYEGTRFGVVVDPLSAGGYLVRAWGRHSKPDARRTQHVLPQFGGARIQLPATSSSVFVGSAELRAGEALLLRNDFNGTGALLVRLGRPADQAGADPFLSMGEVNAQPLAVYPPYLPYTGPSGGIEEPESFVGEELESYERCLEPEELFETLVEGREEAGLAGSLLFFQNTIYVRGPEELRQWCRRRYAELTAGVRNGTVDIEVRVGLADRDAAARALRSGDVGAVLALADKRLRGACRAGDTLLCVAGRERFYVLDHDVEIAEASSIEDPILSLLFQGASLWCRPTRAANGNHSVWFELAVQTPARESERLTAVSWQPKDPTDTSKEKIPIGTFVSDVEVELPATTRALIRTLADLPNDQWTVIGCQGLPSLQRTLVAVARVKAR